jgi:hypothetical protein
MVSWISSYFILFSNKVEKESVLFIICYPLDLGAVMPLPLLLLIFSVF